MNTKRPIAKPTAAELQILSVLWRSGPSTVRGVLDALPLGARPGYTTVLKLMQIMAEKGLVRRDTSERAHVYEASHSEDQTQRLLAGDLLDRAFGGSAAKLVMQALASRPATPDELDEIRRLLDEIDEKETPR